MPAVSQSQRGLIFAKRGKYGTEKTTPKKWKWIWEEGWENKGILPEKLKESKILDFITFVNESNKEKRIEDMTEKELKDENNNFIKLQNKGKLTPHEERRWKKISKKIKLISKF